jgi:hypothetical protein
MNHRITTLIGRTEVYRTTFFRFGISWLGKYLDAHLEIGLDVGAELCGAA